MPFGPIPVIGAGAGAAAALQDQQLQQQRQQDLLAQLYMHAQAMQAQREQTQTYKQLQLESLNQDRQAKQAQARSNFTLRALDQIPGGRVLPPGLAATPEAQDVSEPQPIAEPQPPAALANGGGSAGESSVQDTIANSPAPAMRRMIKIPSPQEQERAASLAETKSRDALTQAINLRRIEDTEGRTADTSAQGWQRIQDAMDRFANRPAATVVIQTVDDQGRPVSRIVPKTAGAEYARPVGATLDARLASASSVLKTGNDIIQAVTDPKISAKLGPAMSRYNNLMDFIGNPPKEFAKLAGQIESYSLANMGVHGMRSASGAEAIKQTIGLGRHTPESLQAVIEGLNGFAQHLMEDQGRPVPSVGGGGGGNDIRVGGIFNGRKILKVEPVP